MKITDVDVTQTPGGARLSAVVAWERASLASDSVEFVYKDVPPAALRKTADPFLASMLIPAMAVGEDVFVDGPVSPRLMRGIEKIVRVNNEWHPYLRAIRVGASTEAPDVRATGETASMFSGGLDSFFTVLRPRREPVTMLLTVIGFDLRFEKRAFVQPIVGRLENAAAALGRRLVVVDSNAYEIGHKYVFNAEHHGGFLASVALGMQEVTTCYIPSSWPMWRGLPPFGSHPATDYLWSTESLEVVHDGVETARVEKGLAVGADPVLLEHLRVCVQRPDLYNCGRCAKCVATALNLQVAGTLDKCATLGRVDARTVARSQPGRIGYKNVFEDLHKHVRDPDLRRAIRRALRRLRVYTAARPVIDAVRRRRLRQRIRRFAPGAEA